jgi:16S rRNA (guanine(1405)-N(7))-methyltransferase
MDDNIFKEVKNSKKYNSIYDETIRRICAEEQSKFNKRKEIVKSIKNKLHQISKSYFLGSFSREIKRLDNGEEIDINNLLKAHTSTNERLSFSEEFYDDIFGVVGKVDSILDIACGLNPIMLGEYFSLKGFEVKEYIAQDINLGALKAVNCYFDVAKRPVTIEASDLLITIPAVSTELALLLKIVPLLEQQKKDYYAQVINDLQTGYIVVTFPTKTMSGKNVGMSDYYRNLFNDFILSSDFKVLFTKEYDNELLYILAR